MAKAFTLIDEILSGLIGSSIAEWAKKRWPPRVGSLPELSFEQLRQRYGTLYLTSAIAGGTSFVFLFVYMLARGTNGKIWPVEVWFGFPFTLMTAVSFFGCIAGGIASFRRFLRYWELKQGLNLWLLVGLLAPMALLGVLGLFGFLVGT